MTAKQAKRGGNRFLLKVAMQELEVQEGRIAKAWSSFYDTRNALLRVMCCMEQVPHNKDPLNRCFSDCVRCQYVGAQKIPAAVKEEFLNRHQRGPILPQ